MSVPQVVYTALRGLVSDRCWPNRFAQPDAAPVWPAIRYVVVDAAAEAGLCGTDSEDTDDVRVQIDLVASTYALMRTLKAQAIAALAATDPPCSRVSSFETYDAETRTHRAMLEYVFQQSSAL